MERRDFIYRVGLAGASLPFLDATAASAQTAQAKSVIYIFLSGGLSQYDSFNVEVDKPVLGKSNIISPLQENNAKHALLIVLMVVQTPILGLLKKWRIRRAL